MSRRPLAVLLAAALSGPASAALPAAFLDGVFAHHDVLLVGESHDSLESIETLTRAMPRLKADGVRAVGIEGLKRPHQAEVDAYVSGRRKSLPKDALSFSPRRAEAFAALLAAARDNGVRVVALGLPLDHWAKETAALAAEETGKPAAQFAFSAGTQLLLAENGYVPGFNEAVAEVYLKRRNEVMAEFLAAALKNGGKAVALVGEAHVEGLDAIPARLMNAPGSWGTLAEELTKRALRAFSLTQTGGRFTDADSAAADRAARPRAYGFGDQARRGAPAFLPLGPDGAVWFAGAAAGALAR